MCGIVASDQLSEWQRVPARVSVSGHSATFIDVCIGEVELVRQDYVANEGCETTYILA